MPVTKQTAVPIAAAPMADYFEIAHIDTSNRDTGIVVEVWWNAWKKQPDGTKMLVANLGPHAIEGDRLLATSAECLDRANAFVKQGVDKALALQAGYRDAIYAELAVAGKIPA